MKNNIYKEQICIKYKKIIEIIGVLSKGYIIQKQLIQYMIILDIANSEYKCRKIIEELQDAELIKKINFEDTKNKIILLRKYAIRFLQDKKGSKSVGAISTCTTSKRYYKSIFINHFILELCKNEYFSNTAKKHGVIKALEYYRFNFALDNLYLYKILREYKADELTVNTHIEKIQQDRLNRQEILANAKKGIRTNTNNININLTETEKRQNLMLNSTLETLKRKDCYIRIFRTDLIKINICYLDYCNTQNNVKIIENISIIMAIMRDLFPANTYVINFQVCAWDEVALRNILKKLTINDIQDKIRLYSINISTIELKRVLNIQYLNIDMYKNYLANVKKIID